jgi:chorismate mutase
MEAREETGIPVATEVANAEHVELCLNHGVDVLWIGARTTANPFSVQEIADALKGVDVPVMIKNPVNPDLNLWVGAIERIQQAGIKTMAAIHRGFSFYGQSEYRNKPMWEIPIALKTWFPELPLFCDPSHISGNRAYILSISQRALDLGMDGLMIESHPTPKEAWSDALQQITPDSLAELIKNLRFRKGDVTDQEIIDDLGALRSEIDGIDDEIISLLASRMEVAEKIGTYKKLHDLTVLQLERWQEILQSRSALGSKLGLSKAFIDKYLEQIHKESIRRQTEIMNGGNKVGKDDGVLW